MSNRLPARPGEWIQRQRPLRFSFEGRSYTGFEGDTVTSALLAAAYACWAAASSITGRAVC
jgi:sarcosine oxidase, subunit alpha